MRIALDATPLTLSSGGLARYTAELASALRDEFPEDEITLVSDQPFRAPGWRASAGPRRGLSRRWWAFGLNRELSRLGAHLFHGANFSVPYLPLRPSVLSIHDLSPWMDPAWHGNAARVRRRTPWLLGLDLATAVVTDCESVRREVMDRFRVHPSRIAAVPLAAASVFQPAAAPPRAPYLLFAGTLEPRKNIAGLLAAWREVRRDYPVDLVLVGRRRADFVEPPPEPGLCLAGELPDADLAGLYSGAVAFVYPSLYEGFGLPVLEAMQCGAPVIASEDAALREVAGGAALHASAAGLAAAIRRVVSQPAVRAELQARGLARAREFSWRRTARLTREVYEQAWSRFHA